MEKLGIVLFSISCSPSVQKDFERGVALLHSFASEDAAATFTDVEKRYPDCAMAYWGEAMRYYHQIWGDPPDSVHLQKGSEACQKAEAMVGENRPREGLHRGDFRFFTRTGLMSATRSAPSSTDHYPDDKEAAVFYALGR